VQAQTINSNCKIDLSAFSEGYASFWALQAFTNAPKPLIEIVL
jgi:hypothetical protein